MPKERARRSRRAVALGIALLPLLAVTRLAPAEEPVGVHPSPLFIEHCAKCHGADGKAETPEGQEKHAEVFNDPKWQESKRKKVDKLIASVTNGHGKKMPAFKDKLKPEEIRGLVEKDVLGPWK